MQTLREYIEKHYSIKTVGSYLNTIKNYTDYMQDKAIKATYNDILAYIGFLRTKALNPKTLRNVLFAIRIYYRWLVATGQRTDHPCQRLYLKDQINRAIPVESLYSMATLENILKTHVAPHKAVQKRDEAIISLLIYQALRVDELCRARIGDVNLYEGTISVRAGEGTKNRRNNAPRTLALKPNQIMLLHDYLNETRPKLLARNKAPRENDLQALIVSRQGAAIAENSSINRIINAHRKPEERISPTRIRQSVIAHLLKQHNDIRVVQVFAGHRRAGSTEEYKQTGLEELKAVINKCHPLN
jgi:site-specific recombinase XerD